MAPKKNKKKNAFFYFMQEIKQKSGFNNLEAQEVAGEKWSRMTRDERRPYEIMASERRNNPQIKKYTSDGMDIEQIEKEEQEELAAISAMQQHIHNEMVALYKAKVIHEKNFFVIHINNFCYRQTVDKYYPAEIALLKFNLRDGVQEKNIFHSMVHPGQLPLGFTASARLHSQNTHRIKPPPSYASPSCINNMEQVFNELCKFVKDHVDKDEPSPIIYVKEKYMKQTKNILDMWENDYNNNCYSGVYNLQFMFNELRSTIEQSDIAMSNSFGFGEISRDIYSHVPDIGCEFHESLGYQLHCSKSIVTRQAYIICENCCPVLNLKVIPGRHVPKMTRLSLNEGTSSRMDDTFGQVVLLQKVRNEVQWKSKFIVVSPGVALTVKEIPSLGHSVLKIIPPNIWYAVFPQ